MVKNILHIVLVIGLDGIEEKGNYKVNIDELLGDVRIWRTIVNGYPYKTAKEIGVDSDYDAYFATKQAIYCVILNRSVSMYKGLNSSGKKVVNAIQKLKDIGLKGTQTPQSANLQIEKLGEFIELGEYCFQEYIVTSGVNISSYKIEKIEGLPEGSFVANTNGDIQNTFNGGDKFRIIIPKSKLENNIDGAITVTSKCETYPIFYGKTTKANTQDYAVTYDKYRGFYSCSIFKFSYQ